MPGRSLVSRTQPGGGSRPSVTCSVSVEPSWWRTFTGTRSPGLCRASAVARSSTLPTGWSATDRIRSPGFTPAFAAGAALHNAHDERAAGRQRAQLHADVGAVAAHDATALRKLRRDALDFVARDAKPTP